MLVHYWIHFRQRCEHLETSRGVFFVNMAAPTVISLVNLGTNMSAGSAPLAFFFLHLRLL